MAPGPEKVDVKRADNDKAAADKMALLKELAKMSKPLGVEKKDDGKVGKKR